MISVLWLFVSTATHFDACPPALAEEIDRVLASEHASDAAVDVRCEGDKVTVKTPDMIRSVDLSSTASSARGRTIALVILQLEADRQRAATPASEEAPPATSRSPTVTAPAQLIACTSPAPREVWTSVGALTVRRGKNGIRLGFSGGWDPISPAFLGLAFSYARGVTGRLDLGFSGDLKSDVVLGVAGNVMVDSRYRLFDGERVKLTAELSTGFAGGFGGLGGWTSAIPMYVAIRPALSAAFLLSLQAVIDIGLIASVGIPLGSTFHFFAPGVRIGFAYQWQKVTGFFINVTVQPVINFESAFRPVPSPFIPVRGVLAMLSLGPQWQF